MATDLLTRSDGTTVNIQLQDAEQAEIDARAKRVISVDSDGNILLSPELTFTQALDNNANGQPIYLGLASPGTAKSAASWQIRKLTYDGVFITDIQFADGDADFDNIWDDRTTLTYS